MKAKPNLRVLYVDDEHDLIAVVTRALKLDPHIEVVAVDHGVKALDHLQSNDWRPDVILLDVMMPDLDGPGTIRQIFQLSGGTMPVIFFTARTQHRELIELMDLGAIGVLTKPFDPLSLASDVRRLIANAKIPPPS